MAMPDHDDSAAMFGGDLEDSTLANFFGSEDHSIVNPVPVAATAAAANNGTVARDTPDSGSPVPSVVGSTAATCGSNPQAQSQSESHQSGPPLIQNIQQQQQQPFFPSDPNWVAFGDTPPYEAYDTTNPFDASYPGPTAAQFSQQQPWEIPPDVIAAQFGNPQPLSHTNLPQRPLPPGHHQHQQHPQQQLAAAADISPIALQAEPYLNIGNVVPPTPVARGHVRPNPTAKILQALTPAQQERLKNIAMPAHLQYHSPKSEGSPQSSPSDKEKGDSISSPEAVEPSKGSSRKRKSSADDDDDDDDEVEGLQPIKKTAHNMIEKRYRTNLNDKIAALRDSVPSLRIMSKSARGEDTTEDREELHGLTPAHKLNKATVLSKATEYIRHLEKRNNRLIHENDAMQQRISAFEKLFMAGAMNGNMSPLQQPPTPIQFPQDAAQAYMNSPMTTPGGPDPQGMIPVPEDMKRIIQAQVAAGRPYPIGGPQASLQQNAAILRQQQIQQQQQQIQQGRWSQSAPYFGKLMVGSLAGLMILEAVRETEESNETPQGRGLFTAPLPLLRWLTSSSSTAHFGVAGYYFSVGQVMYTLKFLLLFGSLLYAFLPSVLAALTTLKPRKTQQQTNACLAAVPSLASPIHVRRQAWLTAIQTLWVPRHNFILEAAALVLKTMKLSLRNVIGTQGYQLLTSLTQEQEEARVKAWTIALDAQLAGGDIEINKSRLTLTLLASGTLPDTPLRLMLKALHIRILLWQLGKNGVHNVVAAKLARSNWNQAKQLFRLSKAASSSSPQPPSVADDNNLPDHLAILLEQECDDVLNDDVVQRAHNLAWNRPTTHDVHAVVDGMNAVVEDPAIKSPMDAVAAWWSSLILHQVLSANLAEDTADKATAEDSRNPISFSEEDLDLAVKVAPVGSNAQVRAVVARTFLSAEDRAINIADALQAMAPSTSSSPSYSAKRLGSGTPPPQPMSNSSTKPLYPDPDAKMALHCAMVLAHLSSPSPKSSALELVNQLLRGSTDGLTLLGFAAAFKLIVNLHRHPVAARTCSGSIERLAAALRIWIGGSSSSSVSSTSSGVSCGGALIEKETRHAVVQRCLAITKSIVGMDTDPGYGSMSDCEGSDGSSC